MIFYNTAPHSLISLSHTYQPSCFTLARLHTLTPTANSFHPQSNEHTSPPLLYYNDKLSSQPVLSMTPSSMCTLIYIYTHTPVPLVYLPAPSHTGEDVRPIIRALLWARGRGQLHERSLINEKDRWYIGSCICQQVIYFLHKKQPTQHTHPSNHSRWHGHTHTLVHTHIHDHIYMSTPTHTQSIEQSGFAFSDKPTKSHMLPQLWHASPTEPSQHNNLGNTITRKRERKKNLSPSANKGWQCAYKPTKPAARWRSNWLHVHRMLLHLLLTLFKSASCIYHNFRLFVFFVGWLIYCKVSSSGKQTYKLSMLI